MNKDKEGPNKEEEARISEGQKKKWEVGDGEKLLLPGRGRRRSDAGR